MEKNTIAFGILIIIIVGGLFYYFTEIRNSDTQKEGSSLKVDITG